MQPCFGGRPGRGRAPGAKYMQIIRGACEALHIAAPRKDPSLRHPQLVLQPRPTRPRREIMKATLLAAAAAISLGIGTAYAGDGEGPAGGYVYPGTIFAGSIYAGTQTPARSVAAPGNSGATNIFG